MTPASPARRFPHLSRRQVLAWGLGLGLAGTGVGAAQGYIFAAPMAADALDTFRAPDLD